MQVHGTRRDLSKHRVDPTLTLCKEPFEVEESDKEQSWSRDPNWCLKQLSELTNFLVIDYLMYLGFMAEKPRREPVAWISETIHPPNFYRRQRFLAHPSSLMHWRVGCGTFHERNGSLGACIAWDLCLSSIPSPLLGSPYSLVLAGLLLHSLQHSGRGRNSILGFLEQWGRSQEGYLIHPEGLISHSPSACLGQFWERMVYHCLTRLREQWLPNTSRHHSACSLTFGERFSWLGIISLGQGKIAKSKIIKKTRSVHFNNSLILSPCPSLDMEARARAGILSNWNKNLSPFPSQGGGVK